MGDLRLKKKLLHKDFTFYDDITKFIAENKIKQKDVFQIAVYYKSLILWYWSK